MSNYNLFSSPPPLSSPFDTPPPQLGSYTMSPSTHNLENLLNGSTPDLPTEDPLKRIYDRYQQTKLTDAVKNEIIDELLIRYEYHVSKDDNEQAVITYAHKLEQENAALRQHLACLTSSSPDDDYIFVLLDCNSMIFDASLLQMGAEGAVHALNSLKHYAIKYTASCQHPFNRRAKVVVRIYANASELAEYLRQSGIITDPSRVTEFLQALPLKLCDDVLCDFVNFISTQKLTETKLKGLLDFHLRDHRCLQVYLGCPRTVTTSNVLAHYSGDLTAKARLAVVDCLQLTERSTNSPFRHVVFSTLFSRRFMDDGVLQGVPTKPLAPIGTRPPPQPPSTQPAQYITNTSPAGLSLASTPASGVALPYRQHRLSSVTTVSSEPQLDAKDRESGKTWAKMAEEGNRVAQAEAVKAATIASQQQREAEQVAAETKKFTLPPSKAAEMLSQGTIPRNKLGQRIDPPVRKYDRDEVNRVRSIKWCLVHFLTPKGCPYRKCQHKHEPAPGPDDLQWLRLVGRLQPCNKGPCEDVHCCYGHRCLAPVKDGSKRGVNCTMGGECKFDAAHHNVDTTIVKTVKI